MTSRAPSSLTVENLTDPIHVWTSTPRFGWRIHASQGAQTAYELEVLRAPDGEVVAATGKTESSMSHSVTIPDVVFPSRTRFDWRVRVWTGGDEPGEWARASFETTILHPSEWVASWIEPEQERVTPEPPLVLDASATTGDKTAAVTDRLHPSPLLRQGFELTHAPERARLYITARGVYEVTVNGSPITDEVLAPGYDDYKRRLSFQTYDATHALREGENVVGIRLADGWWAGRISFTGTSNNYGDMLGVIWQLEGDGEVIASSGTSARSSFGETRYADIFVGEKADGRFAQDGWELPGFDDSAWAPAQLSSRDEVHNLVPFIGEPVRRVMELENPRILTTPAGEVVVDLGQNIAGRLRLTARGHSGTTITLEHTESLDRDGNYQQNIVGRNKDQTDVWVLKGGRTETYEPRFSFHGFRYVRVTGYPGELKSQDVVGVVIASDLPETGRFITDNPRINRLHENVVWSQRGNFLSIPTDCPQRERAGWTGDVQVFSRAATNNARVDNFFDRWLANVRVAQSDEGIVPMIVPNTPSFAETLGAFMGPTSAGWGDVITILPLALYERYGDVRVLADNYPAMRKWVSWVRQQAEQETAEQYKDLPTDSPTRQRQALLWNTGFHFGDWLVPSTVTADQSSMGIASQLTGALFASAFYFQSVKNLARAAHVLDDQDTAIEMRTLAGSIAEAFRAEFLDETGALSVNMQGAYVIALAFGLVPEHLRAPAGRHLVRLIHDAGDHLDTGFLSVPYLLDVLVSVGERELAYALLFQDTVPSWLYEVDMGATTIWESWAGVEPDGQPRDLSLNHYAFGAVDDWMFRHVAGINAARPGYAEIDFSPDLFAPFDSVAATISTPFGQAGIEWKRTGGTIDITVTVPGNTRGKLLLPGSPAAMELAPGRVTVRTVLAASTA